MNTTCVDNAEATGNARVFFSAGPPIKRKRGRPRLSDHELKLRESLAMGGSQFLSSVDTLANVSIIDPLDSNALRNDNHFDQSTIKSPEVAPASKLGGSNSTAATNSPLQHDPHQNQPQQQQQQHVRKRYLCSKCKQPKPHRCTFDRNREFKEYGVNMMSDMQNTEAKGSNDGTLMPSLSPPFNGMNNNSNRNNNNNNEKLEEKENQCCRNVTTAEDINYYCADALSWSLKKRQKKMDVHDYPKLLNHFLQKDEQIMALQRVIHELRSEKLQQLQTEHEWRRILHNLMMKASCNTSNMRILESVMLDVPLEVPLTPEQQSAWKQFQETGPELIKSTFSALIHQTASNSP